MAKDTREQKPEREPAERGGEGDANGPDRVVGMERVPGGFAPRHEEKRRPGKEPEEEPAG